MLHKTTKGTNIRLICSTVWNWFV